VRFRERCAAALLLAAASWGCARQNVESRPAIVLATVEGLRGDLAGEELLPATSALFPASDSCRATAVSPAAASAPALSSLLTGLSPWRHRVVLESDRLAEEFRTVAEVLRERGYRTAAFEGGRGKSETDPSWDQGLDLRGQLAQAPAALSGLSAGQFVWLHLEVAGTRYRGLVEEDPALAGLTDAEAARARRGFSRSWLERAERRGRLSPAARTAAVAAYRSSVMAADGRLQALWRALGSNPGLEDAWVVMVGVQGDPLGEGGHWARGRDLSRGTLAVPLWVRWPRGVREAGSCSGLAGEPSSARLFATLLEFAGVQAPPGVPASFLGRERDGALSELYRLHGANQFSWVRAGRQFTWTHQFTGARVRTGRKADRRLAEAFTRALPLHGASSPPSFRETQFRETPWGAALAAPSDPAAAATGRAELEAAFLAFVDRERAPFEEIGEVP
jgi:arylsulfatase A-like enzyme